MTKKPFRLIPVLDLKDRIVVHGVRGEREKYQPIESVLTTSAEVGSVIEAFVEHLGLREFYVADLDAIISSMEKDQLSLIARYKAERKNSAVPLSFMLDAGVLDAAGVGRVLRAGVDQVIVATETLPSLAVLNEIVNCYGSECLVVSIDIKDARILSPSPEIAGLTPPEAVKKFQALGINQFILLELSKVGTGVGLNQLLIQECLTALADGANEDLGSLIIGGGVKGREDLHYLAQAGAAGALVATALHNGRIDSELIDEICQRT
ncbi:MAG: HisA/HisF-related TIM barrel protein [Desulfitobacterium hafniense]|nr:HisA/HisF-related TIM barrel protein [Desulfitobacterium hafniense]